VANVTTMLGMFYDASAFTKKPSWLRD